MLARRVALLCLSMCAFFLTACRSTSPPTASSTAGQRAEPPHEQLPYWDYRVAPWGRRAVLFGRQAVVVDIEGEDARAEPLIVNEGTAVLDVAMQGEQRIALGLRTGGSAFLAREHAGRWREEALPARAGEDNPWRLRLAADGETIFVCGETAVHRLQRGRWQSYTTAPRDEWRGRSAPRAIVAQGRLFVGYAAGEWGGGLLSLDERAGTWRSELPVEEGRDALSLPVVGLFVGPGEELWAIRGLSHLGLHEGRAHRRDSAGQWHLVARTRAFEERANDSPMDDEDDLGFDDGVVRSESGDLFLLARHRGLLRLLPNGRHLPVAPSWPREQNTSGIVMLGHVAIIGTLYDEALVVDVRTGALKRLFWPPLRPSRSR